ncbi:Protein N-acetyltransferase, RimJ/RimL family [Peptoclostridium litorale DSM 5388]|uniref:Putative GCN5-liek N-acetyltransferase n=1 Tax=Peptoclostridium litorale DSM 5388 TaxID=1121324 RepID=A0A069RH62_PEPLI|nr:GNAT family N-acetyltransferase [Peptoclostridium litorale]KDR96356.1 putative GCN5-liek N-acetyltransferase [Peptoclostridium litorale DSM 5388]SIO26906.1 Protein N-acetyltransferase, RimJ/RimL family [Peptoclostridium litorale DSM 5388]
MNFFSYIKVFNTPGRDMRLLSRGKKTFIRRLERKDVDEMIGWGLYEEDFLKDYSFPSLDSEERDIWFKMKNNVFRKCFAVLNENMQLIGYISLRDMNFIFKRAEMGIVFSPAYVGRGYGKDAIMAFLEYYFKGMKYKKLMLTVAAYNKRAYNCYVSCGFKITGRLYMETNLSKDMAGKLSNGKDETFKINGDKVWALFYKMNISTLSTK